MAVYLDFKIYFYVFFLGFFSYICMYLDMAFLIHSWVYFVVIVRACIFTILAIFARFLSHSCWMGS